MEFKEPLKKLSNYNDFFLSKPNIFFYFFCDFGEILKYGGLCCYFFCQIIALQPFYLLIRFSPQKNPFLNLLGIQNADCRFKGLALGDTVLVCIRRNNRF